MSKQRTKPGDGQPSNKHGVFAYFLANPENFAPELAHEMYPAVKLATIVAWDKHWRKWDKSTFTGTDGFPRGMADTEEQIATIKNAIKRARSARGTGDRTVTHVRQEKVRPEENFTGELTPKRKYAEGAVSQVLVNRFERDSSARAACLEAHGYSCAVCEMNFTDSYGEIGDQFIHVHHRHPLALRRENYEPKPIEDLVPVCPNCHAMLHTSDPPLTIDELRRIWMQHNPDEPLE